MEFCQIIFGKVEEDDIFVSRLVFSDKEKFHLNGKVKVIM